MIACSDCPSFNSAEADPEGDFPSLEPQALRNVIQQTAMDKIVNNFFFFYDPFVVILKFSIY